MAAPLAMELQQRSRASIEAIVPAHQSLYGPLDSSIGHYRRYSLTALREELERAGFDVLKSTYLNMLGAAGWLLNGLVLRAPLLPPRESGWRHREIGP